MRVLLYGRRPSHWIAALFVAIALAVSTLSPATAQSTPTVSDGEITNNFPQGVTFRVSAKSDSPIETVRLRYKILPDGTQASGRPDFKPAKSIDLSHALKVDDIYLPPGTIIEYHWEVTDAEGDVGESKPASFFYDDIRFDWTPVEQGGVTIYYYSGSQGQAQRMLDAAGESIAEMSELMGTTVDFPVKVWIYDSTKDMRPALQRKSATYEQSITTAGTRVASDTVLVLGNASFDTLRHELTHIVTAVAGEGPLGKMPAWLDEGTAVYGQGDPGGFKNAVDRAVDRGNVFSLRQITSYPGDPSAIELFYGQSWSVVNYLNETYGHEKSARLFAEIKSGKRMDSALEAAYGFDQDGLDNEWRASLGLPPRDTPEPTSPDQPSPAGPTPSDGGTSSGVIVALILGVVLLAGAIGFAGWRLARRLG